jgi:hypothetical protein
MNFSKLWKLWKTGVLKLWKPLENRGFKTLETLEMDFGK